MQTKYVQLSATILILILMLMTANSVIAKITPKSVWHTVEYGMIRTSDVFGNKLTLTCNGDKYMLYLSLRSNTVTSSRRKTFVSYYINRKIRNKYTASVNYDTLAVKLDYSSELVKVMMKSLDINAFVEGGRGTDIFSFALDGFSDELNRACH